MCCKERGGGNPAHLGREVVVQGGGKRDPSPHSPTPLPLRSPRALSCKRVSEGKSEGGEGNKTEKTRNPVWVQ